MPKSAVLRFPGRQDRLAESERADASRTIDMLVQRLTEMDALVHECEKNDRNDPRTSLHFAAVAYAMHKLYKELVLWEREFIARLGR